MVIYGVISEFTFAYSLWHFGHWHPFQWCSVPMDEPSKWILLNFCCFFRLDCLCVCVLCVRDLYLNPMCTSKMANTSAVHEHTRNVKVCFCHVTHEVQNYESPIKNMHKSCKLALCHPKQLLAILIKIFFVRKRKYCLNTQNHSDKQK